jgi:hypothetical protein
VRRLFNAVVARLRRGSAVPPPGAPAAAPKAPGNLAPTKPSAPPAKTRTSAQAPTGRHLAYAPQLDGRADPGEIVWTYVAYEDDPQQGKDRPVLVVGRQGSVLLGLMLSSNHSRDGQHNWFALGSGDWDRTERPSWVRLDRVLRVAEDGIRREGAVLGRARFDAVAARLRNGYGWR